ncbi:hypothetical protein [Anaerolentibacter hominis]|uniref:hypothetical protein n=1 Tax=Anaerolentibacter hominis TaxID=3079009 RepID=UPI0031B877BB
MKRREDLKIFLIGVGYLAYYITPCYRAILRDNIGSQMIGIKGSERGLKERQELFPFPLQVQNTRAALDEMKPDLILLAPKPDQIPGIMEEVLIPYYEDCRKAGEILPDLYSFAPDPQVSYFYDKLGGDVNEANLLPNMVNELHGINVAPVGVSFISFDERREWPEENKKLALDFLKPTATVIEVPAKYAVPFLALKVASHTTYEMCFILQDVLKEKGIEVPLAALASAMRTYHRENFKDIDPALYPCSEDDAPEEIRVFICEMVQGWYRGIVRYAVSIGMDEWIARRMAGGTMELHLMTIQMEPREVLDQNVANHATKGGVLEKAIITFDEIGYQYLTEVFRHFMEGYPDSDFDVKIEQLAFDVTKAVSDHGMTLGKLNQK